VVIPRLQADDRIVNKKKQWLARAMTVLEVGARAKLVGGGPPNYTSAHAADF